MSVHPLCAVPVSPFIGFPQTQHLRPEVTFELQTEEEPYLRGKSPPLASRFFFSVQQRGKTGNEH